MEPIIFVIPIKTVSEANARSNRWDKARRVKSQREAGKMFTMAATQNAPGYHCHASWLPKRHASFVITLTRVAPGLLDSDNLASSQKAIRDGIADALGLDDGDTRLTWAYAQRRLPGQQYAVDVKIEPSGEVCP